MGLQARKALMHQEGLESPGNTILLLLLRLYEPRSRNRVLRNQGELPVGQLRELLEDVRSLAS